ncbi:MAG: hypothetical protein GF364_18745 [Candidatus Lokiarchaeota archaeon]|nr:hypothetical protein [Candidatus Lokiarchaeota archaeon]
MSKEDDTRTKCAICGEEKDVTEFYYCLCDTPVCSDCIDKVKVNDKEWKCPKCGQNVDLKSTRLFREHEDD